MISKIGIRQFAVEQAVAIMGAGTRRRMWLRRQRKLRLMLSVRLTYRK